MMTDAKNDIKYVKNVLGEPVLIDSFGIALCLTGSALTTLLYDLHRQCANTNEKNKNVESPRIVDKTFGPLKQPNNRVEACKNLCGAILTVYISKTAEKTSADSKFSPKGIENTRRRMDITTIEINKDVYIRVFETSEFPINFVKIIKVKTMTPPDDASNAISVCALLLIQTSDGAIESPLLKCFL